MLGEGFNLLGEFLVVTGGLFQVLKLLVTGLDALIELGDLGFQFLDLAGLFVEVGAGNKTLTQCRTDFCIHLISVGITQNVFHPLQFHSFGSFLHHFPFCRASPRVVVTLLCSAGSAVFCV